MPAEPYIPALGFRVLTPFYDTFLRVALKENVVKTRLLAQLDPKDSERILDFGCGTGTLTLMIKKAGPGCSVIGIDIDRQVLEIAGKKARRDEVDIQLIHYDGNTLPFSDEYFDKVVTSLVLHHLSRDEKFSMFREISRILKRGGRFHIMDFGIQRSFYTKFITSILKHLEPIEDNILGRIPEYLAGTGFHDVEETGFENTLVGTLSFYRAEKP